jgi:hypothetical protein
MGVYYLLVLLALAFIFIKMTPNVVLVALHNPVIMFLSILFLLWTTTLSPKLGVLGLLWIGGLYLERNRQTLYLAASAQGPSTLEGDRTMPVSPSQFGPSYMRPSVGSHAFAPSEDATCDEVAGAAAWSAVGRSINHKAPLRTVPPGAATMEVLNSGSGWWRQMFGEF